MAHDFRASLERSHDLQEQNVVALDQFFRQFFGGVIEARRINDDSEWQRHGVDWFVRLKNGNEVWIDEKIREIDYGDVLLELWSQWRGVGHPKNKVGWSMDTGQWSHWIAYVIGPAGTCYMLQRNLLLIACRRHAREWVQRYGWKNAQNNGYSTRNVAVPWPVLRDALTEAQESIAMPGWAWKSEQQVRDRVNLTVHKGGRGG